MRALCVSGLLCLCGALVIASCKSNDIAASSAITNNTGQSCRPDASSAVGNGCGGGVCLAGYCRQACISDAQCSGEAGTGGICLTSGGQSGCALESEVMCNAGNPCPLEFACGTDFQCHTKCAGGACPLNGQTCAQDGACYVMGSDGGSGGGSGGRSDGGSGSSSGGGSGLDATTPDGGATATPNAEGGGTDAAGSPDTGGNACPNAQTQFGLVATGDENPGFTSGVGVRTPNQLLVFSGYDGPDPNLDGGDGGNVNLVYWQAFDPVTATSLAPAQPLALANTSPQAGSPIYVEDVSIAPTGEIALLYSPHVDTAGATGTHGLSAAFISLSADGGSPRPEVQRVVALESDDVGSPPHIYGPTGGQPHVIWSTFSKAFVFSWTYYPSFASVKVKKYLPNGASAGGDTDTVPTGVDPRAIVQYESGSVATSGSLFGVAYLPYANTSPYLTMLDALGNQVGTSIQVDSHPVGASGSNGYYWVTAAGTAQGVVYFSGTLPVTEFFVPTSADAGAATPPDGGSFAGFTFTGARGAVIARAISDDPSGAGGVGAVLLYTDGASFVYVNSDGVTHVGPNQVISHAQSGGDEVTVTEFGGSFGISLYSAAEHVTRIAASGCR